MKWFRFDITRIEFVKQVKDKTNNNNYSIKKRKLQDMHDSTTSVQRNQFLVSRLEGGRRRSIFLKLQNGVQSRCEGPRKEEGRYQIHCPLITPSFLGKGPSERKI
jgi:hypothetical protein